MCRGWEHPSACPQAVSARWRTHGDLESVRWSRGCQVSKGCQVSRGCKVSTVEAVRYSKYRLGAALFQMEDPRGGVRLAASFPPLSLGQIYAYCPY